MFTVRQRSLSQLAWKDWRWHFRPLDSSVGVPYKRELRGCSLQKGRQLKNLTLHCLQRPESNEKEKNNPNCPSCAYPIKAIHDDIISWANVSLHFLLNCTSTVCTFYWLIIWLSVNLAWREGTIADSSDPTYMTHTCDLTMHGTVLGRCLAVQAVLCEWAIITKWFQEWESWGRPLILSNVYERKVNYRVHVQ